MEDIKVPMIPTSSSLEFSYSIICIPYPSRATFLALRHKNPDCRLVHNSCDRASVQWVFTQRTSFIYLTCPCGGLHDFHLELQFPSS